MNTNNAVDRLSIFDITDYLLTGEDVSEYLRQVIADKDAEELVRALEYIKRSVGMAEIHQGKRGCTEFCVNGLMTGNRRISRSGYDLKHKESSAQRSH